MATKADKTPKQRPLGRVQRRDATTVWLERTNPLAGLSIRNALSVWDCARGGDTQRLHWIFQEIEAANPILMVCVERRASALAGYRPIVTVRPDAEGALGDEQKAAVEEFLGGIRNLAETVEHLDNGFFRGFAYAQPIWEADGTVREIRLPNSWEFVRRGDVLYHNPWCDGFNMQHCVDTSEARLIGLTRKRAIDVPALAIHIRHAVGERDWGRFLERYALPKPAVIMAPNATNEQRSDYLAAASAMENGQVSVWPNGTNISDFAGASRGTDPFATFIDHQEKLIVLLATGGTLTSLAQADTGSLAGGAQMEVWKEIVQRDASYIASALFRDLVRPFMDTAFAGQDVAIDFNFEATEKRSAKEAAELAGLLKTAGYTVDQGELERATGFTLEKDAAPAPNPFDFGRPGGEFRGNLDTNARESGKTPLKIASDPLKIARAAENGQGEVETAQTLLGAFLSGYAKDAEPAAQAIRELLADLTPEKARALIDRLPDLLPEDPEMAAVLAEAMANEFADAAQGENT